MSSTTLQRPLTAAAWAGFSLLGGLAVAAAATAAQGVVLLDTDGGAVLVLAAMLVWLAWFTLVAVGSLRQKREPGDRRSTWLAAPVVASLSAMLMAFVALAAAGHLLG